MKLIEALNMFGEKEDFFFVQIGSNDGVRNDPLYEFILRYKWSGIMVEPVPYLYERLIKNHAGNKNLTFKNLAIANKKGKLPFFYIKDSDHDQTNWRCGNGLGSFIKENVLKHKSRVYDFEENFSEMQVSAITFNELVRDVDKIDLLCIDAEGYDFEIIKTIDFKNKAPSLIYFEYKHIKNINYAYQFLRDLGYDIYIQDGENALCINHER